MSSFKALQYVWNSNICQIHSGQDKKNSQQPFLSLPLAVCEQLLVLSQIKVHFEISMNLYYIMNKKNGLCFKVFA